jgi:hypothetical protein
LAVMGSFGLVAVVALVMAADFSDKGRTFPVITAGALIVMIAAYLAVALVPALRSRAGGMIADGGGMEELVAHLEHDAVEHLDAQQDSPALDDMEQRRDAAAQDGVAAERVKVGTAEQPASVVAQAEPATVEQADDMSRRLRISLLLVVVLLVGIILFGLDVTVPVIFVLFLRLVTRERWLTTVATTVISCAALYLVFHTLLDVPLEGGLLLTY